MNKKGFLDYLFYKINQQRDFALCGLYKLSNGEIKSTKWTSYQKAVFPVDFNEDWKLKSINQRQVLPCEIVLDLENREQLNPIIKELRQLRFCFYVYSTCSRGYHVHIFFNRALKTKEKLAIIKYFKADEQKATEKTLIALENAVHWKSGKIKEEMIL